MLGCCTYDSVVYDLITSECMLIIRVRTLQTIDKTTGSASKRVLSSISTCAHLLHMARL